MFFSLPFCGGSSLKLKRQLIRMFSSVAPWVTLRIVFKPALQLSRLCKLKSPLPALLHSNVVYHISCADCSAFYIGMTTRRLEERVHEHKKCDDSSLKKHASTTGHTINFSEPRILTSDILKTRLYIKETLKISEFHAYKSLNGNIGSFELKLW